jgi:hypothetical protein
MIMTEKNNLSVSQKFWIGILIAILGIIVSLFVTEVRFFLGIGKAEKVDTIQEPLGGQKPPNVKIEQEKDIYQLLEVGKANTIEEAKKTVKEKEKAELDKWSENYRLEKEIRLLEEAKKLLK